MASFTISLFALFTTFRICELYITVNTTIDCAICRSLYLVPLQSAIPTRFDSGDLWSPNSRSSTDVDADDLTLNTYAVRAGVITTDSTL